MHGDPGVAQHRLDPRRGHVDVPAVRQRIPERDELAVHLVVLHLGVGQARLVGGTPVDEPFAAVDEPLLVPPDERDADRAREPSSIVNRSRSQSREQPMRFSWPMISPPYCSFHRQTRSTNASGRARGDRSSFWSSRSTTTCVAIPAWSIPGTQSAAGPRIRADQDVLDRATERVTDVEPARHVRRRDHDAVGARGIVRDLGVEVTALDPRLRPSRLDRGRVVAGVGISGRGSDMRRVYRPTSARPLARGRSILRASGDPREAAWPTTH